MLEKRLQKYLYKNNIGSTLEKRLQKKQTLKVGFSKPKTVRHFRPTITIQKRKSEPEYKVF